MTSRRNRLVYTRLPVRVGLLVTLCVALCATTARAQDLGSRQIPSLSYFAHLDVLHDGDSAQAAKLFRSDLQGAIRTTQTRWIDSICYYTMLGESLYRMGNFAEALDNYNAAVKLAVAYPDWMLRVQFPAQLPNVGMSRGTQWGRSERAAKLAKLPATMLIGQGRINNDDVVLRTGGVVQMAQFYPVQVQEIIRCLTLAIKRRADLMGPLCPLDPLTGEIVAVLARRQVTPNHWSEAWVDVPLGMAYLANNKPSQALPLLQRGTLLGGELDHPLTALALMGLGNIATQGGDYNTALKSYLEATYSSVDYPDPIVLEEAFTQAHAAHWLSGKKGPFMALRTAVPWSRTANRQLRASLALMMAENYMLFGQGARAANPLGDAKADMARRDVSLRVLGARWYYIAAGADYQRGNIAAGDTDLATAIKMQAANSTWLFQIALADNWLASGKISPRVATTLYPTLLREPTGVDWLSRPLESMAVQSAPQPAAYEQWFLASWERDWASALEVADQARVNRFRTTLPLGGRLLALRWLMESPAEVLDQKASLERQDLLAKFPKYAALQQEAKTIADQLKQRKLKPGNADETRTLTELLNKSAKIAQAQEVILREIAVSREPADLQFPPLRKTKDVQAALKPGQLVLTFFAVGRDMYAVLMSHDKYAPWKIESPQLVEKNLIAMLRGMGHNDANREVMPAALTGDTWRKASKDLLESLLAKSKVNFHDPFDEMVIVPDGILWYLPFEALDVGGKQNKLLLSKTKIRYAPTLGLVVPDGLPIRPNGRWGVVAGKLFPREDAVISQSAVEQIVKAVPGAVTLVNPSPVASPVYASILDGVAVLEDLPGTDKGGYNWSPLPIDRQKNVGTLENWFALPAKQVEYFILPGFHTIAETGLKLTSKTPGNEVFLSLCGLMSTGARTVLISRWRPGGASTLELVREFVQELPFRSAAASWQRAAQLEWETPLNLAAEPRVKYNPSAPIQVSPAHPFFWAGLMVVDTGRVPGDKTPPVVPRRSTFTTTPGATAAPKVSGNQPGEKPTGPAAGASGGNSAAPFSNPQSFPPSGSFAPKSAADKISSKPIKIPAKPRPAPKSGGGSPFQPDSN